MPSEGALNTAIRNATPEEQIMALDIDPAKSSWSSMELLMATLIDEIRNLSWMYATAHSKSTVNRPDQIRRPGVTAKHHGKKLMRMSDVRALDPRLRHLSDDEVRALMVNAGGGRINGG
jgi:hypothetical protein